MIELLLLIALAILGTLLGCITGLVPGLHVNNLALILLSISPAILLSLQFLIDLGVRESFILLLVVIIILATSISHTFVNFIPSTFLGAPEGETALSVLPAHSMLLDGKGYQAVYLSAIGSFSAIVLGFTLLLPFRFIIGEPVGLYSLMRDAMPYILIAVSLFLIFSERAEIPYRKAVVAKDCMGYAPTTLISDLKIGRLCKVSGIIAKVISDSEYIIEDETGRILVRDEPGKIKPTKHLSVSVEGRVELVKHTFSRALGTLLAVLVYFISGAFGIIVFEIVTTSPVALPSTVLFPALSGLFGTATLIHSLRMIPAIPEQSISKPRIDTRESLKSVSTGSIAGSVLGFFPGVTASHGTIFAMTARKNKENEQVILTLSSVNTAYAFFCLAALFIILRPRNGATIAISQLIVIESWNKFFAPQDLLYLLIAVLIAGLISFFMTIWIGKWFAKAFQIIPYKPLIIAILIGVTAMVFLFCNLLGLLILGVATAIGLIAPSFGVRRSHAMGVLLLPIILKLLSI